MTPWPIPEPVHVERNSPRTLGRVVAVFTELQEAYDYVKHHHPRFCVSGSVDGWCVYEWIKREVP